MVKRCASRIDEPRLKEVAERVCVEESAGVDHLRRREP